MFNLTVGVIPTLGLGVTAHVFIQGSQTSKNIRQFLTDELPIFQRIEYANIHLAEQERLYYLMYATEPSPDLTVKLNTEISLIESTLIELQSTLADTGVLADVETRHGVLTSSGALLIDNLLDSETDWDLAREQLEVISEIRRDASNTLQM